VLALEHNDASVVLQAIVRRRDAVTVRALDAGVPERRATQAGMPTRVSAPIIRLKTYTEASYPGYRPVKQQPHCAVYRAVAQSRNTPPAYATPSGGRRSGTPSPRDKIE
jgi:hypothetical protein